MSPWTPEWQRRVLIGTGVVVAALLVGALLGLALAGRPQHSSRSAAIAKLTALAPGSLVAAPGAQPDDLDEPRGIGSLHEGVAVVAASKVDEVRTSDGRRRAPTGSRLIAFRVTDWTCEDQPCGSWRDLAPSVQLDDTSIAIPAGGDTFVVVVPPGSSTVDLVVDADGYRQSVSLVDGEPGAGNIVLLSRKGQEKRVAIGRTYHLVEHTSVALDDGSGGRADTFQREIGVVDAQLTFFQQGETPSRPDHAFLVVNAWSSYAGSATRAILGPGEVVFVDDDGHRYEPLDLDPTPEHGLLGFEVPATLRSGTLMIGGVDDKVSTTGVPYVSTLQEVDVPISLR